MAELGFLSLLVDGAPYSRYEEVRQAALASSAASPDAVQAEFQLALQLRDVLDRQRARQDALRGLLECAKDLADVPSDVDATLTSIVTRAQRLLDCDLAYLSLNDPHRQGTYVRVMVGATSMEWKELLIPYGMGVGGMVAKTAAPYATADYFSDDRLVHAPEVDASARAENQVAILGVPLIHRSHVIGVLYASNRTPGAFSHEAISTLSSFAALAAVAINQAQLLQDKEQALVRLHAVNDDLETRTCETERAVEAHDRMMDIVLRGGGMKEVVSATTEPLGGKLAIFDETNAALAWTTETTPTDIEAMRNVVVAEDAESGRAVLAGAVWIVRLIASTSSLGTLVWAPDVDAEPIGHPDRRILERAGVVASLLQLFKRDLGAAEARVRGELLDELLAPSPTTYSSLASRAHRLRYRPHERHVVLVAESSASRRQRLSMLVADLASARNGLSTSRDGTAVLVLPVDDTSDLVRQLARSMAAKLQEPVTIGAAGPISDPVDLPSAFAEATACKNALVALGRAGDSATAAELGFIGLLLGDHSTATDFVTRTLGPLLEHDTQRAAALVQTLYTYYEAGQSVARSARELHVHPHTVTQRLDRIKRLLGPDWNTPAQSLDLQLALRLLRLGGRSPDLTG
jgi:hypothetical protein